MEKLHYGQTRAFEIHFLKYARLYVSDINIVTAYYGQVKGFAKDDIKHPSRSNQLRHDVNRNRRTRLDSGEMRPVFALSEYIWYVVGLLNVITLDEWLAGTLIPI